MRGTAVVMPAVPRFYFGPALGGCA